MKVWTGFNLSILPTGKHYLNPTFIIRFPQTRKILDQLSNYNLF